MSDKDRKDNERHIAEELCLKEEQVDLDSFVRRVFKSNNLPSKFNLKLENTSYNQRSYSINIVPIVFHNSPSYLLVFNDTTIRNHNLYL